MHSQADPSSLRVDHELAPEIRPRPLFAAMVDVAMAHGNARQELTASESSSVRDPMMDFQQLANEVFSDLLKHGRPRDVNRCRSDAVPMRNKRGASERGHEM